MIAKSTFVAALSLALATSVMAAPQAPLVVALYIDITESAQAGRELFLKQAEDAIVRDRCLGRADLAIILSGETATLLYADSARNTVAVRQAFAAVRAGIQRPQAGSDVVAGLDAAERWLAKPEYRGHRRILIAWGDMENTAAKTKGGRMIRYPDPRQFHWLHAQPPELHVFGLPREKQDALQKAWATLHPCLHQPGEPLRIAHFGWKRSLFQ